MRETRILMGMPITVEVVDTRATDALIDKVFAYFTEIDERFSTYKSTSEITGINEGRIKEHEWSPEMQLMMMLGEETKQLTNGFFDMRTPAGNLDPSGIVKGWAIWNAAKLIEKEGFKNFYVDAGGDIEVQGSNPEGNPWAIGIKNPFNESEIIKRIYLRHGGVATSGTYIRGLHIYNPRHAHEPVSEIVSLTVIGPNVYEADRFATAAFAMGKAGIHFIEQLPGLEGYMIDTDKIATMTTGFERYTSPEGN